MDRLSPEGTTSVITSISRFVASVLLVDTLLRNPELNESGVALLMMVRASKAVTEMFTAVEGKVPQSGPMTAKELAVLLTAVMDKVKEIRDEA